MFEDAGGSGDEALGLVDGLLVGGQVAFAQRRVGPFERPGSTFEQVAHRVAV